MSGPNIYLIGFMGTGKTTVGRCLAKKLHYRFIDSDKAIEKDEGCAAKDIIKQKGLPYFRQCEQTFIESGHPKDRCVISCGGGIITTPGTLEKLKARGLVVALFASIDTLLERTGRNDRRPLLQVDNPRERIEALLKERMDSYLGAHTAILTDQRSIQDVVTHVERFYQEQSPGFKPKIS
ncbi:MAG TPA: shikimate kinase [Opitutae bacterium]|nr:shikimate kinase [Opitutae bacterium]|tara:strand:- start:140 stop:679 length:540 start_codon:yes stop_codon:yes gene_type:complete